MRNFTRPGVLCLGVLSCLVALENNASAQSIDGAFRLGFEGVLFSHDSMTVSPENTTPTTSSSGLITTPPSEVTVDTSTSGILPSTLGLGLGYAPSSNVVLGLHSAIAKTSTEVDIPGTKPVSGTQYSILPSFEFIPSLSGSVLPFLEVRFGWRGSNSKLDDEETSKSSTLVMGGGGGVHLFANDFVSIDPGIHAYYLNGSYKSDGLEMTGSGYNVMMSVALSAWLGGKGSHGDHEDTPRSRRHRSDETSESPEESLASSSAAPPPPRPRPQALETAIPIGDQSLLVITGAPKKNGDALLLQWRVMGQAPWKRDCKSLKLVIDGEDHAMGTVGRRSGFESYKTWTSLGAQVSAHTVVALSEAKEARLVACNASLGLYSARSEVAEYVDRFREAATKAGTWKEPEPAPAAEPETPAEPAAQPSSDTAPAQPPAADTPAPATNGKKADPAKSQKPKAR